MDDESKYILERERMVDTQIAARGVRDPRVLKAMRSVPRHCFISSEYHYLAYTDGPLPIGSGQTISQPYIVALMSELMELTGGERVLEIGAGSGYQAAILGFLAGEVHSIERHEELARNAAETLQILGFNNVHIHVGDGTAGLPEKAPFDAIMVSAAAPRVPRPLFNQLMVGGRLIIPVGGRGGQFLERWRRGEEENSHESLIPVAFVPLIGEMGWKETD